MGIAAGRASAGHQTQQHRVIHAVGLDLVEGDVGVGVGAREGAMECNAGRRREEAPPLRRVGYVTDEHVTSVGEQGHRAIEEREHARLSEDVVQDAVGDDHIDPPRVFRQQLRAFREPPDELADTGPGVVVGEHLLGVDHQQEMPLPSAVLSEKAGQVAASWANVEHQLPFATQWRKLGQEVTEDRWLEALPVVVGEADLLVLTQRVIGGHPTEVVERQLGGQARLPCGHRGKTIASPLGTMSETGRLVRSAAMRVLVTGGSRGIGAEVVRALARRGDEVVAVGRDAAALDAIAAETGAEPLRLDVTNAASWERVAPADGLVCAAGVLAPYGPLGSYQPADFWRTMEINVLGTLLPVHHLRPRCTVTFSGGGGASPWPRYDAYATSKAAVVRLTENLAADGLTINAIAPGLVLTEIHAQRPEFDRKDLEERAVPASEAAELAALLLDDPPFSGKLISAPWDPWRDPEWRARLAAEPDLATLRRIDDHFFTFKA